MDKLGIVIPVYNHWDYAQDAIQSALRHTRPVPAEVVVVDDASEEPRPANLPSTVFLRLSRNSGLTAAWNAGLRLAREADCTFTCVTNSDVLFSPGWCEPLLHHLSAGNLDLAGPVSNAPGSEAAQEVRRWLDGYVPSDREEDIAETAARLRARHGLLCVAGRLNGFCLLARTRTWWDHCYADGQPFRPRNDTNARGQRNPTPLMTLQEYELQQRWRAAGLRAGFCPGSFVFHYRSVTRGDKYRRGQWLRKKWRA